MAIEKKDSIKEHIDRIKFITNYTLNEAKYSLVTGLDEDDDIPDEIWTSPSPVSKSDSNVHEDDENPEEPAPEADVDVNVDAEVPMEEPAPEEPVAEPEMGMEEPLAAPEPPSIEDVQNDILKSSVSAMQKMNDQLQNLELTLQAMNQKMAGLNNEVEQVKEPTNVEKLVARKEDSYPYYMNLNDMWNGNSFQARRQMDDGGNHSKEIRQLEDGTYIADFDSLPKYNEQEIKDSF